MPSALSWRTVNVQLPVDPKAAGSAAPHGCLQIHGASWHSSENPQDAADVIAKTSQ